MAHLSPSHASIASWVDKVALTLKKKALPYQEYPDAGSELSAGEKIWFLWGEEQHFGLLGWSDIPPGDAPLG